MDNIDNSTWRKASYSGNSGNCVETGVADAGRVLVRDTTDCEGGTLAFTADAWQRFTDGLK
jgi:Domain of unknown function (DUF397)